MTSASSARVNAEIMQKLQPLLKFCTDKKIRCYVSDGRKWITIKIRKQKHYPWCR